MKALKIIGALLAIFLAGYLIDWIASREERAILSPVRAAVAAIEGKDWAALEKFLDPDFSYGSPVSWVGEGNLEGLREKLSSFWPQAEFLGIVLRESKTAADGVNARAELVGNVKFSGNGVRFAIYKFKAMVGLRKVAGSWSILRVDLPQLEPGLF